MLRSNRKVGTIGSPWKEESPSDATKTNTSDAAAGAGGGGGAGGATSPIKIPESKQPPPKNAAPFAADAGQVADGANASAPSADSSAGAPTATRPLLAST